MSDFLLKVQRTVDTLEVMPDFTKYTRTSTVKEKPTRNISNKYIRIFRPRHCNTKEVRV